MSTHALATPKETEKMPIMSYLVRIHGTSALLIQGTVTTVPVLNCDLKKIVKFI